MYEYQIAWKNHQICNEQPYLNEMAKKGWRLITAIHTSMSPTIKYYWEREIPSKKNKLPYNILPCDLSKSSCTDCSSLPSCCQLLVDEAKRAKSSKQVA